VVGELSTPFHRGVKIVHGYNILPTPRFLSRSRLSRFGGDWASALAAGQARRCLVLIPLIIFNYLNVAPLGKLSGTNPTVSKCTICSIGYPYCLKRVGRFRFVEKADTGISDKPYPQPPSSLVSNPLGGH